MLATQHLSDSEALSKIASTDADSAVRQVAVARLAGLRQQEDERQAKEDLLARHKAIANVAYRLEMELSGNGVSLWIGNEALERVAAVSNNASALAGLAMGDADPQVRLLATALVTDQSVLAKILLRGRLEWNFAGPPSPNLPTRAPC